MRKHKIGLVVGAVAALVFAATAFAGKPTSSLKLIVLPSGSAQPAALTAEPSYGGEITFEVKTTETDHPSVNVRCFQDGAWVYDGWESYWKGAAGDGIFTLSSGYWTGGAADCTARLVYYDKSGRLREVTSTDFHATA
jgi:hypothetical protein